MYSSADVSVTPRPEYPADGRKIPGVYTRPAEYRGMKVPDVLLQGDHARIEAWRRAQAEALTRERRPDLWERYLAERGPGRPGESRTQP